MSVVKKDKVNISNTKKDCVRKSKHRDAGGLKKKKRGAVELF